MFRIKSFKHKHGKYTLLEVSRIQNFNEIKGGQSTFH